LAFNIEKILGRFGWVILLVSRVERGIVLGGRAGGGHRALERNVGSLVKVRPFVLRKEKDPCFAIFLPLSGRRGSSPRKSPQAEIPAK